MMPSEFYEAIGIKGRDLRAAIKEYENFIIALVVTKIDPSMMNLVRTFNGLEVLYSDNVKKGEVGFITELTIKKIRTTNE